MTMSGFGLLVLTVNGYGLLLMTVGNDDDGYGLLEIIG
jgi:hypothetical protein